VELVAVTTHGGHVGAAESPEALEASGRRQAAGLVAVAEAIRAAGLAVPDVSPGSTLSARFDLDTPGVTEVRPGTYVFNDANTVRRWSASLEECAAWVLATVVSRPAEGRAVIDAGSKTFSSDRAAGGEEHGYGIVKGRPELVLARLTEEHGVLEIAGPGPELRVGDRLAIVPNHICTAVNLTDVLYGVREGRVVSEIAVAARGRRT
jgi:D-serine deaminase-like pyridoxal phosphate-dependent protein